MFRECNIARRMKMKNNIRRGIAVVLAACMLSTTGCVDGDTAREIGKFAGACYVDDKKTSNGDTTGNGTTVSQPAQNPYQNEQNAVYNGEKIVVKRDEILDLNIGFEPYDSESGMIPSEMFEIYADASLTIKVDDIYATYDFDTGKMVIDPYAFGIGMLADNYDDSFEDRIGELPSSILRSQDEFHSWGNVPQYYMVSYVDRNTGHKLATPEITVIEIDEEINEAPRANFSQTEDGNCRIYWKPVEGEGQYVVYTLAYEEEDGYSNYANIIGMTDQTEWIHQSESFEYDDGESEVYNMNKYFYGEIGKMEDWEDAVYIGVIAVNSTGASSFSNMVEIDEIRATLPYSCAYVDDNNDTDKFNFGRVDYISELPSTTGIEMCDETITQKVIEYDIDNCRYNEDTGWLELDAKVNGTQFSQKFKIYNVDKNTYMDELKIIKGRQESLIKKGGDTLGPEVTITDGEPATNPDTPVQPDAPAQPSLYEASGNSDLSRHIATELLKTSATIDVSEFPESIDKEALLDAFNEARYQNPMILGIQAIQYDPNARVLYVQYDYDATTTEQKRQEVKNKVDEVIGSIITDGMSELDKETAINNYLCDNAEYDQAACQNAIDNDFYKVDEQFYDSFTAYGILVNGVGVCASYAADFKLLADAAGLECIVVTGMLEGSTPHAWNKVKIDGQWYIVDSTNNDSEYFKNGLLNLSDEVANGVLVQDNEFALDGNVTQYAAPADDKEYYHVNGKYFSKDEIASKLAEGLNSEGTVILRTDYNLSDSEFNEIAQEVANQSQDGIKGGYWFGVIYLANQ